MYNTRFSFWGMVTSITGIFSKPIQEPIAVESQLLDTDETVPLESVVLLTDAVQNIEYFQAFDPRETMVKIPRPYINETIAHIQQDDERLNLRMLLIHLENKIYLGMNASSLTRELLWRLGETTATWEKQWKFSQPIALALQQLILEDDFTYKYGIRCLMDEYIVCDRAALYGNLRLLQWARKHECQWCENVCASAAKNGQLHVLQWAHENGCPWDSDTCSDAAGGGHLNVLQWAREKKCPWSVSLCAYAAHNGHLHVLQWARANGCPWDAFTCSYAAKGGHLNVLQWAHQNGCPWNTNTCFQAAEYGHLHVLQWARQQGCPWNYDVVRVASSHSHSHIVEWARANGCSLL